MHDPGAEQPNDLNGDADLLDRLLDELADAASAQLEHEPLQRLYRQLRRSNEFQRLAAIWTRQARAPAVPQRLLRAMQRGDELARELTTLAVNLRLSGSPHAIDSLRDGLTALADAVDWLHRRLGPELLLLWASRLPRLIPGTTYAVVPAVLAHPQLADLTDTLPVRTALSDPQTPVAFALAAAIERFAAIYAGEPQDAPWDTISLAAWDTAMDDLVTFCVEQPAGTDDTDDLSDAQEATLALEPADDGVELRARLPQLLEVFAHVAMGRTIGDAMEQLDGHAGETAGTDEATEPAAVTDDEATPAIPPHHAAEPAVATDDDAERAVVPDDTAGSTGRPATGDARSSEPLSDTALHALDRRSLARQLDAGLDRAVAAVGPAHDALRDRRLPDTTLAAALVELDRLSTAARERTGIDTDELDELIQALLTEAPADPAIEAAATVEAVVTSAEPAADAVRRAAHAARDGAATFQRWLPTVVRLLSGEHVADHATLTELTRALDGDPDGIALALATGALTIDRTALTADVDRTQRPTDTPCVDEPETPPAGHVTSTQADTSGGPASSASVDTAAQPCIPTPDATGTPAPDGAEGATAHAEDLNDEGQAAHDGDGHGADDEVAVPEAVPTSRTDTADAPPNAAAPAGSAPSSPPDAPAPGPSEQDTAAPSDDDATPADAPSDDAAPSGDEARGAELDPADLAALEAAFCAALDRDDAGAAGWIADTAGLPARRTAARLAAYAAVMRRDGGPAATAFQDTIADAAVDALTEDVTSRILLVAATCRAALVRPYVFAHHLDRVAQRLTGSPHLHDLVDTIVVAARAGVSIGSSAPVAMRQDDTTGELADRAAEVLDRAGHVTGPYQAATVVWQAWLDDDGLLGGLLAAVRDDQTDRHTQVHEQVQALRRPGALARHIDLTDPVRRRADRIDGRARRWLVNNATDVLDLVDDWLDKVRTSRSEAARPYAEQQLANLRDCVAPEPRQQLYTELAQGATDPAAQAALGHARRLLDDAFDRLLTGRPYTGADGDPAVARSGALLATPLALDLDSLDPVDGSVPVDVAATLGTPADLRTAFETRLAADEIDEATRIVELLGRHDPTQADELLTRLQTAAAQVAAAAEQAWTTVNRELLTAQRQGWLAPDDAREVLRELEAVAITREREDLGRARRRIEALRTTIHTARDRRVDQARAELTARAHEPAVAAHLDRLHEALDRGDLLSCDEMLRLLDRGEPLATAGADDARFNGAFATVVDVHAGRSLDADCEQAARTGQTWGAIDFAALDPTQADAAGDAIAAWGQLATDRRTAVSAEGSQLLSRVLRAVGFEPQPGRDIITRPSVRDGAHHNWWEVRAAGTRGAQLPRFGSRATVWRILLVRPGLDERTLVRIVKDDSQDRPVIVLRFEALSPERRANLAVQIARQRVPLLHLDDTTFAYRTSLGDALWGTTLALTLPETAENPYIRRGEVPAEMFFGRDDELRQLLDLDGSAVVYGGRQLGKTALLRRARERFAAQDDAIAIYLDIYELPAQQDQRLWGLIHEQLSEAGVDLPRPRRDTDLANAVRLGLRTWLAADPARRALLLLDECDTFLATDRDERFVHVAALKQLMEDSPGRCKVVLSGLHTVQRFAGDANQPLAHLGTPIQIGSLPHQAAYDLIDLPMRALGYRFDDPDTVTRIIAYANHSPAVIQEFGVALIDHLITRRPDTGPPWPVTVTDIEHIAASPQLSEAIASKFQLTLTLDDHYKLIANVMALRAHLEHGARAAWRIDELRDECASYWPRGFTDTRSRTDQFRLLLDEMVGLGVLTRTDQGRYALLNANVGRLLGERSDIEERLLDFLDLEPDPGYQAERFHRRIADSVVPSPLSDLQLGTILQPRSAARTLLTSDALGASHLADAIAERTRPLVSAVFETRSRPYYIKDGHPQLPQPDRTLHRIVLVDVTGRQIRQAERALERADRLTSSPERPGTTTILVQLGRDQLALWRQLISDSSRHELLGLRRLDEHALRLWADHIEQTLRSTDAIHSVLDTTGGWPQLLTQAADLVHRGRAPNLEEAATTIGDYLTRPDNAQRFLDATGLSHLDPPAATAWQLLTDLGPMPVTLFDSMLDELLAETHETNAVRTNARTERELLHYLQLSVRSDEGKQPTIAPEPIALSAWQRTMSGG